VRRAGEDRRRDEGGFSRDWQSHALERLGSGYDPVALREDQNGQLL
jgi:hypothetical protein